MGERVLNFDEALEVVLEHARGAAAARAVETVALLDSVGRVLAERVLADRDQPPFDRATRDGFAVRAGDVGEALRIVGAVRAGEAWGGKAVGGGEAVEIMTGAALPEGADAVVMIEHVAVSGESLRVEDGRTLRAGENVVARGAEARAGMGVLRVGTVIGAAEIAVAASCGCATLPVFARPKVAIVATGDELVELDVEPDATQIRNSNSYALAAMVRVEGGEAVRVAVARDTREDVRARIAEGRKADLLVLSGGVSMGKYDLVEEVLAELGAEFFFTGALIQPGKPVVFGRLPRRPGAKAQLQREDRQGPEGPFSFPKTERTEAVRLTTEPQTAESPTTERTEAVRLTAEPQTAESPTTEHTEAVRLTAEPQTAESPTTERTEAVRLTAESSTAERLTTERREAEWTYFFGLPGNPVSTQVTFGLFVATLLRALAGREKIAPRFVEARLADDVKGGVRVTRFLPAELAGDWEGVTVRVVGWQGSGDVAANARGNCYVVLPAAVEEFKAGEAVRVLLR